MTDEQKAKIEQKLTAWKSEDLLLTYVSMLNRGSANADDDFFERFGLVHREIIARMERGRSNA